MTSLATEEHGSGGSGESVLQEAVKALRAEAALLPPRPPPFLLKTTLTALKQGERSAGRASRRRPLLQTAACVMAGIALVILVFPGSRESKAAGFGTVLSEMRRVSAVSFVLEHTSEVAENVMQSWSIDGPDLRIEVDGLLCQVVDEETGEMLELDLVDRTARQAQVTPEGLEPFENPIGQLLRLGPQDGAFVSSETDGDGNTVDLYHVEEPYWTGDMTSPLPMQVWVARNTGLPVLMRLQTSFDRLGVDQQDSFIWRDFDWDPGFDADWFSRTVPDGYRLIEEEP